MASANNTNTLAINLSPPDARSAEPKSYANRITSLASTGVTQLIKLLCSIIYRMKLPGGRLINTL